MSSNRARVGGREEDGICLQSTFLQFGLMCLVFWLWSSPLIHPVKILVVLFHEMSHGLMAILTGGKVISIAITLDEGGACETEGGNALLIVSAGYLGSMLFGGILLYLSRFRVFVPLVFGILTAVMVSAVATVLDADFARAFAIGLAGAFVCLGFITPAALGSFFLRILGTVSCLYSIFDIYWDVLAERGASAIQNDAIVFAGLSGMSPRAVGLVWLAVCVAYFLFILRLTIRTLPDDGTSGLRGAPARAA